MFQYSQFLFLSGNKQFWLWQIMCWVVEYIPTCIPCKQSFTTSHTKSTKSWISPQIAITPRTPGFIIRYRGVDQTFCWFWMLDKYMALKKYIQSYPKWQCTSRNSHCWLNIWNLWEKCVLLLQHNMLLYDCQQLSF